MADHPRKTIRDAVRDLLISAGTVAQDRVYSARRSAWRPGELPGISVNSGSEESTLANMRGSLQRTVKLSIVVVLSTEEMNADAIDAAALEVETAMERDPTFGRRATGSFLSSSTPDLVDGDGRSLGGMELVYDVTYYTSPAA